MTESSELVRNFPRLSPGLGSSHHSESFHTLQDFRPKGVKGFSGPLQGEEPATLQPSTKEFPDLRDQLSGDVTIDISHRRTFSYLLSASPLPNINALKIKKSEHSNSPFSPRIRVGTSSRSSGRAGEESESPAYEGKKRSLSYSGMNMEEISGLFHQSSPMAKKIQIATIESKLRRQVVWKTKNVEGGYDSTTPSTSSSTRPSSSQESRDSTQKSRRTTTSNTYSSVKKNLQHEFERDDTGEDIERFEPIPSTHSPLLHSKMRVKQVKKQQPSGKSGGGGNKNGHAREGTLRVGNVRKRPSASSTSSLDTAEREESARSFDAKDMEALPHDNDDKLRGRTVRRNSASFAKRPFHSPKVVRASHENFKKICELSTMPSIESILPLSANQMGPVKVNHSVCPTSGVFGKEGIVGRSSSPNQSCESSSHKTHHGVVSKRKDQRDSATASDVSQLYPSVKNKIVEKAPFRDSDTAGVQLSKGIKNKNGNRNPRVHSNILLDNAVALRARDAHLRQNRKSSIGNQSYCSNSPKPRNLFTYSEMESKLLRSLQRSVEDVNFKLLDNSNVNCRIEYDLKKGEENDYFTDSGHGNSFGAAIPSRISYRTPVKIQSDPSGICFTDPGSGVSVRKSRYKRNIHGSPIVVTREKTSVSRGVVSSLGVY